MSFIQQADVGSATDAPLLSGLLNLYLRGRNCWQSVGFYPNQTRKSDRVRFPAAVDEGSRERSGSPDITDQTIFIGLVARRNGHR